MVASDYGYFVDSQGPERAKAEESITAKHRHAACFDLLEDRSTVAEESREMATVFYDTSEAG